MRTQVGSLSAVLGAMILVLGRPVPAGAGELGHYSPLIPNLRDFFVPDPGLYFAQYHLFYWSNNLKDEDGNRVRSVQIGGGGNRPAIERDVDVDVDIYSFAPTFIWVPDWKPFGLKVGMFATPTFATASLAAAVEDAPFDIDVDSEFGLGDLFVQPIWVDWSRDHFDLTFAYGFYAPTGRYDTERIRFPRLGLSFEVEEPDNIGLGFWTHQLQTAAAWYPWEDKRTAAVAALTYEFHQDKQNFDLTPGQRLSLNYGISQYLPVPNVEGLLLEFGPAGYSQWQVTEDSGRDATAPRDEVHGIGGQIGLTYVPWNAVLQLRYLHEFYAESRFQGHALTATLAVKLP